MEQQKQITARQKEIAALREEGRQAFLTGKARDPSPHQFLDAFHWQEGWREEAMMAESKNANAR